MPQERSHVELLRTQLEQQRESAAVGAQASQTIQGLERELASCRALFEQRTREAEGLQRTVRLSDEMAARYKAQLDGLLKANQTAVAREQELEHQVREDTHTHTHTHTQTRTHTHTHGTSAQSRKCEDG